MAVRKLQQKRGWAISVAAVIIKPSMFTLARRRWIDGTKIPATGGCIVALNHISHVDPLLSALFVYDHGRIPRYLAKMNLFNNKALAGFLKAAGQIPVARLTANAAGAFDAAVAAVRAGECVVVYPEGTITRQPERWPMTGMSGAARIALATGCPVIPVAQWGAQEILAPYAKKPDLLPRKTVTMKAGDPVPLDDLMGRPLTQELYAEATERIMTAITELLEELRGEKAPAERFDPRKAGVKLIGNPNKDKKDRKK